MKMANVVLITRTIPKFFYSSRPREQVLMEVFISFKRCFRYIFNLSENKYICILL